MGYHHPRQTNPYLQGNVQGGQPQDSGYNNPRTSRSHSQPSVPTGDNPTLNHSLSANRPPVSGQAQPFEAYGTGQNREPGLQYVSSTNTPQYVGAQGQIQSPSYQDPSRAYQQSTEQYFPLESQPPHLASQQNRTHQPTPQQPSVPHNPSHSIQGNYPQHQRGDVDYSAGHLQQRRSSSSHYPQQQQQQQHQQQPSTQLYPQQPQSSPPQYQQQQQPSTQPYSPHQQSSSPQQRRQYQPSSQQYTQQQQSPPLRQQGNFATAPGNAASTFGPNVPGEIYEMPGEEIRQSRSMHRGTNPLCRLSNCRNPAIRDGASHELTEYCSQDHMQEDTRRGAPLCPACNKCPRRLDGRYCGSACEQYDRERRERLHQPHQQQQQHPRPPSGVRPHLSTFSSSGNATWGTASIGSPPVGNFASENQHLLPVGGLVRCPKCNTTYSARGRSRHGGQGSPVDYGSLPPCPSCGFCR